MFRSRQYHPAAPTKNAGILADLAELGRTVRHQPDLSITDKVRVARAFDNILNDCSTPRRGEQRLVCRTVHHLSCTGGTMLAKCIAAMPNTRVLNEIEPFSRMKDHYSPPEFTPTDLIALVKQADHQVDPALLESIFVSSINEVIDYWQRRGVRTVLRDHAHSHYLVENSSVDSKPLQSLIQRHYAHQGIVTVRDPIDSYLSLNKNGWVHFSPGSFEEYCKRYNQFLDNHAGLDIFKYEDFVSDPNPVMETICLALQLPYNERFTDLFGFFSFSGDSGRSSNVISGRPRRPLNDTLHSEVDRSASYKTLINRLGYLPVKD